MNPAQPIAIQTGDRVKVLVSTEKRDPWLTPKAGWEGIAVAPALNMEATHWQVRFLEPWCSLGITRIMPVTSLQVLSGMKGEAPPASDQDAPTDESKAAEGMCEELSNGPLSACPPDAPEDACPDDLDLAEDGEEPQDVEIEEVLEASPEVTDTPKAGGRDFVIGARFRVKDQAGGSSGEEHIVRRRGQFATVCRICEIATSCVEVIFEDDGRPVMIPKGYLAPIKNKQGSESTPQKPLRAKAQMKLPF